MSGQTKTILIGLLFFLLCCVTSHIAGLSKGQKRGWERGYRAGFEAGYNAPHKADTIYIADTSTHEAPAPVSVKPSGTEKLLLGTIAELQQRVDSLRAAKPDTCFVEVEVPIEVQHYKEEDYEAQVSGWHPSLDWIKVYPKTTIVTQWAEPPAPKRTPRFGFGLTAGPAVVLTPDGVKAGAGVAAGLTLEF